MNKSLFSFWLGAMLLFGAASASAQETAIYRDPHDAFKRGMDFYREQLFGKAREEFRIVLDRQPMAEQDRAPVYRLQAQLYDGLAALRLGRGDAEQALLVFIAENEPSDIANLAKSEIAGYYFFQKNYAKAVEYYKSVNLKGMDNDRILEVKFNLGYGLFVEEKFPEARKYLSQVKDAKTSRFYFPANYYYGCASFLTKDYEGAMEAFQKTLESKEYSRTVPYHICQIHFQYEEYDELIKFGEPLMTDGALNYRDEMGLLIGQAYFQKEAYAKALPYLRDYVNKGNKVGENVMYQLAVAQMETGDQRSAIPNFMQLTTLDSRLGQVANFNIGQCYAAIGNKGSALEAYRLASSQNFDNDLREKACFEFAALAAEVNAIGDAVDVLGTIPESSGRYEMAQGMLGEVLLASNDYDRALTILRKLPNKTLSMKETLQKVAVKRGCQLVADRKPAQAVALFDESLQYRQDPTYTALALYWKGESHYRAKDYNDAQTAFNAFLDAEKTAKNLPDNASRGLGFYGLGYVYLHRGAPDYKNAAANFDKAADWLQERLKSIKDVTVTNGVYMDALMLAGDCFTATGNYKKAREYYDAIISSNYKNVAPAKYSKARLYVAANEPEKAIQLFNSVIKDHPESDLVDDAQYQLGSIYKNIEKFDLAAKTYSSLLARNPNSPFHNQALNDMGIIYLNQNDPEKAVEYFKQVVAHNPTQEECASALDVIERIYAERGEIDEYVNYRQTAACGGDPSTVQVEKLKFEAAEKLYEAGSYERAVKGFDDFLARFDRSPYRIKAFAYRGDSYKELKVYDKALVNFDSVLRRSPNEFSEYVSMAGGTICMTETKDYPSAFGYFLQLEKYASSDNMRKKAYFGILRSGNKFGRRDRTAELCQKILKIPGLTDVEKGEAFLFAGAYSVELKNYDQARIELSDAIKLSGNSEEGARARYELANLYYVRRDLPKAEETAKRVNSETPAYKYWLGKSYLLLADIYSERNELYLAKIPLKRVIEKCPDEKDLVEEAKGKLKKIEDAEAGTNKVQQGNPDGRVKVDD